MRCPLIVGVLVLFPAALVEAQEAKKEAAKAPNYYPLQVDNAWYYKITHNGKPVDHVVRVVKLEDINGVKVARLETSVGANLSEHLLQTKDGVFRYRHN